MYLLFIFKPFIPHRKDTIPFTVKKALYYKSEIGKLIFTVKYRFMAVTLLLQLLLTISFRKKLKIKLLLSNISFDSDQTPMPKKIST
jgi:hypothetical protein